MKHVYTKCILLMSSLFFSIPMCYAEGFGVGTLVKIPGGYTPIERLHVGDRVICYDEQKNEVESIVIYFVKKSVDHYARMKINDEIIAIAHNQRLYNMQSDSWVLAKELQQIHIDSIDDTIDVYLIGVAKHHNFLITKSDICAHNFIPAVVIAISIAIGSGGLEIAGVTCGLAGLGTFLGYKWHKRNKEASFVIEQMTFSASRELDDIYSIDDAQAPGKPTEKDGYNPPKKWDGKKVKNPNGGGFGWPDKKGHIWIPTGPKAHRGPHWDVQDPKTGKHRNVLPGGRVC